MLEINHFTHEMNVAIFKASFFIAILAFAVYIISAYTLKLLKGISKRKENHKQIITSIAILVILYPSSYLLATNTYVYLNEYNNLVIEKENTIKNNLSMLLEEKEQDFKNGEFSINELILEIESHPELFGTLDKYKTVTLNGESLNKELETIVYKQYDRDNPLYKELIISSSNWKSLQI